MRISIRKTKRKFQAEMAPVIASLASEMGALTVAVVNNSGSPAAELDGGVVSARERAAAMLGREGCGLMFGLYSELKPGMRWEYMLMSMSCNALGQPVKVLSLLSPPPSIL